MQTSPCGPKGFVKCTRKLNGVVLEGLWLWAFWRGSSSVWSRVRASEVHHAGPTRGWNYPHHRARCRWCSRWGLLGHVRVRLRRHFRVRFYAASRSRSVEPYWCCSCTGSSLAAAPNLALQRTRPAVDGAIFPHLTDVFGALLTRQVSPRPTSQVALRNISRRPVQCQVAYALIGNPTTVGEPVPDLALADLCSEMFGSRRAGGLYAVN